LETLSRKYIWWKTASQALAMPERVVAQVMNIGDYNDMHMLAQQMGDAASRHVLLHAQAGQFGARSWAYWHYRLGLARVGQMPPLPIRSFG
jgi:hypothetical protein